MGHAKDIREMLIMQKQVITLKKLREKKQSKKMLRRGNIRVMCQDDSGYLFQVKRNPTSEQKAVIRKAREQADELGIPFLVCRPTKQLFMGKAIES